MASPLQRASTRRKLIYLGIILGLFAFNTFFWRGVASQLTGGQPLPWTVTAQGNHLELREVNQGEAELTGSAIRLGLTGSRGLATTILWSIALEHQRKHEWNKHESVVQSLTKLQPHFLTPWLYQSWNLSYNVSVESDRVKDKYFYIGRGIELLAEGERLNKNSPDMRYWIAFYYQMKFGTSDEANTLRSLLQLSCIDPNERDPARMRNGDGSIKLAEFERFCLAHPQLVRRLRDKLRCNTPADVVDFLAENRRIPTRYNDPETDGSLFAGQIGKLKDPAQQFPVVPQPTDTLRKATLELAPGNPFTDEVDNYAIARTWFTYAQEPLPEPEVMVEYKSRDEKLRDPAYAGYRLPRQPAEVIFRQAPGRSQAYTAERLQKEGWFDESGWNPDADRSGSYRWFPERPLTFGTGRPWGVESWTKAYALWQEQGRRMGMYLDPNQIVALQERARPFREKYKIFEDNHQPTGLLPEDAQDRVLVESLAAHRQLKFYQQNREMTNFPHHYFRAYVEKEADAVQARKLLFEAVRQRNLANSQQALTAYEQGFEAWKKLLLRYPEFRADNGVQEDIVEEELNYLQLLEKYVGPQIQPAVAAADVLGQALARMGSGGVPTETVWVALHSIPQALPFPIAGPLERIAPDGQVWLNPDFIKTARARKESDAPQPPPPGQGAPPK